jgi:P27 family predicted phage terminase small subunit
MVARLMARGGARVGSGPKAKPTAEKEREGTARRDRDLPDGVIRPPADGKRPITPAGLTPQMKAAWTALLDDLESAALLDSADAPLYEAFAVAFGRAREARALVAKHGMLVAGAREGQLVANPMLKVEKESLQQLRMLAEQLAIGMSARARLGLAVVRGARRTPAAPDAPSGPEPARDGIGPSPRLHAVAGGKA